MQNLLYESYTRYGSLTATYIDRMRLRHRLRVVQSLEDSVGCNVVRSVSADKLFKPEELKVRIAAAVSSVWQLIWNFDSQDLLALVREEQIFQRSKQPAKAANLDPSTPYYELFKVDFELFQTLFTGLSPWSHCSHAESLAARIFRVRMPKIYENLKLTLLLVACS